MCFPISASGETSGLHLAAALAYWAAHERDDMCAFAGEGEGEGHGTYL